MLAVYLALDTSRLWRRNCLAYRAEPRATIDIDVNAFVAPDAVARVLEPLADVGAGTAPFDGGFGPLSTVGLQ